MTPRVENNKKYCDFGCESGQYLYYDGTCSNECALPSVPRKEGDKLFCDYSGCESLEITHLRFTPTGHAYKVRFVPATCNPDALLVQEILNTNEDLQIILKGPEFFVAKNRQKDYKLSESVLNDISVNLKLVGS